jgi:hypothetical protein
MDTQIYVVLVSAPLEDRGHCYSYRRSRHYQEEQQDLLECIERRQVHRIHAREGHGADS